MITYTTLKPFLINIWATSIEFPSYMYSIMLSLKYLAYVKFWVKVYIHIFRLGWNLKMWRDAYMSRMYNVVWARSLNLFFISYKNAFSSLMWVTCTTFLLKLEIYGEPTSLISSILWYLPIKVPLHPLDFVSSFCWNLFPWFIS